MTKYLEGKKQKDYSLSPNVIAASYNPYSGLIVSTDNPTGKYIGYYVKDNLPAYGESYYDDDYDYYGRGNYDDDDDWDD